VTSDEPPVPTRWDVHRIGFGDADYHSAKGRMFVVGDRVNMPPPLPRGSVWRVVAVDPPETAGYDGTLVLEQAAPPPDPEAGGRE
jgi:hypothetical protein